MAAALYSARVMHARPGPLSYRFIYRIVCLFLDIDRVEEDTAQLRWFSLKRWNLFGFRMSDHLPAGESDARAWIESLLARYAIKLDGGPIRLLCMPRVLGYVFDPISVWYCYGADAQLRAILCEVRNTFGEKHLYLLPAAGAGESGVVWAAPKAFHVSPFFPVSGRYRFRFTPPDKHLAVHIEYYDRDRLLMRATLSGQRHSLDDHHLLIFLFRLPLMTFKVMAMIHWQALKLWLRGAHFHRKPPAPVKEVTLACLHPRNRHY